MGWRGGRHTRSHNGRTASFTLKHFIVLTRLWLLRTLVITWLVTIYQTNFFPLHTKLCVQLTSGSVGSSFRQISYVKKPEKATLPSMRGRWLVQTSPPNIQMKYAPKYIDTYRMRAIKTYAFRLACIEPDGSCHILLDSFQVFHHIQTLYTSGMCTLSVKENCIVSTSNRVPRSNLLAA